MRHWVLGADWNGDINSAPTLEPLWELEAHLVAKGGHVRSTYPIDAIWTSQSIPWPSNFATPNVEMMADHEVLESTIALRIPKPQEAVPEFRLARHAPVRIRWQIQAEPEQAATDEVADKERWVDSDESEAGEEGEQDEVPV